MRQIVYGVEAKVGGARSEGQGISTSLLRGGEEGVVDAFVDG